MSGDDWRSDPLYAGNAGVQRALDACEYVHFRHQEHTFTDKQTGEERNSRGHVHATACIVRCPGNLTVVGLAYCHPNDVSSKRIGREVALGRSEAFIADLLGVRESPAAPVRSFESDEVFEDWLCACREVAPEELRNFSVTYTIETINE